MFSVTESAQSSRPGRIGFVSVLNASGSALIWSTLLFGAELSGLAIDDVVTVYVSGWSAQRRHSVISNVLVASLSESGHKLSYLALFDGSNAPQEYAISTKPHGDWIFVTGFTNLQRHPSSSTNEAKDRESVKTFAMVFQPCRTGIAYSQFLAVPDVANNPEIAIRPALDTFAGAWSPSTEAIAKKGSSRPFTAVAIRDS